MPAVSVPVDIAVREGWALEQPGLVDKDCNILMRRCGIELNEAEFLLEAAAGDVSEAIALHKSCASFAGAVHTSNVGTLTAASTFAMANASPPSSIPHSPEDGLASAGSLSSSAWPTVSLAQAAAEDWDVVEHCPPSDEEDWVEIEDEDDANEKTLKPAPRLSFKQALAKHQQEPPCHPQSTVPSRSLTSKAQPKSVQEKDVELHSSARCGHDTLFEFDEDIQYKVTRTKRDGHSKNSRRGSRHMAKTKQARAQKNSARR